MPTRTTGASTRTRPGLIASHAICLRAILSVDLDQNLYALAPITIDLIHSLFQWARFRQHKAAVKLHTLLDLQGNIPTFLRVTAGAVHDVNFLDEISGSGSYVMDRSSKTSSDSLSSFCSVFRL